MRIDHERAQEKILLSSLEVDDQLQLSHITINNTGTIEVKIRAIYVANSTETMFLCDPSTYMDTYISPGQSLRVSLPDGVDLDPQGKIVAATERGVKSVGEGIPLWLGPIKPPTKYDPAKLYIGPLMLQFDAFWYRKTAQNGSFDPNDLWYPGWSIPRSFGYTAWNITVMNVDNKPNAQNTVFGRNLTINRFSSFTAVPNDSPSNQLTWYLQPTNQTDLTQFLAVNQTRNIVYIWSAPKTLSGGGGIDRAQKSFSTVCRCMVFLTFFGVFHEHDGTTTPYAQTIPFEAAITVT